jgi:hypothetical protein
MPDNKIIVLILDFIRRWYPEAAAVVMFNQGSRETWIKLKG